MRFWSNDPMSVDGTNDPKQLIAITLFKPTFVAGTPNPIVPSGGSFWLTGKVFMSPSDPVQGAIGVSLRIGNTGTVQDVTKFRPGPTVPFTLEIKPKDQDWLKEHVIAIYCARGNETKAVLGFDFELTYS